MQPASLQLHVAWVLGSSLYMWLQYVSCIISTTGACTTWCVLLHCQVLLRALPQDCLLGCCMYVMNMYGCPALLCLHDSALA